MLRWCSRALPVCAPGEAGGLFIARSCPQEASRPEAVRRNSKTWECFSGNMPKAPEKRRPSCFPVFCPCRIWCLVFSAGKACAAFWESRRLSGSPAHRGVHFPDSGEGFICEQQKSRRNLKRSGSAGLGDAEMRRGCLHGGSSWAFPLCLFFSPGDMLTGPRTVFPFAANTSMTEACIRRRGEGGGFTAAYMAAAVKLARPSASRTGESEGKFRIPRRCPGKTLREEGQGTAYSMVTFRAVAMASSFHSVPRPGSSGIWK